jgi:hypothetical protein
MHQLLRTNRPNLMSLTLNMNPLLSTHDVSLSVHTTASNTRDASQSVACVTPMDTVILQHSKDSSSVSDSLQGIVFEHRVQNASVSKVMLDAQLTSTATTVQAQAVSVVNKVRYKL